MKEVVQTGEEKVDSENRLPELRCHCGHALFLPVLMCNTRTTPPNPFQLGVDQDTVAVQTTEPPRKCQAWRKRSGSAVCTKPTFPRPLPFNIPRPVLILQLTYTQGGSSLSPPTHRLLRTSTLKTEWNKSHWEFKRQERKGRWGGRGGVP